MATPAPVQEAPSLSRIHSCRRVASLQVGMPFSMNGLAFSMRRRGGRYLAACEALAPMLPNSLVGHRPERKPELLEYEKSIQARTSKMAAPPELAAAPHSDRRHRRHYSRGRPLMKRQRSCRFQRRIQGVFHWYQSTSARCRRRNHICCNPHE